MRIAAFIFLLLTVSVRAETIWIAQTAAGGDTGADAANAHAMTWFNTAGNWGGGAGEIDPGDTVMFSGTITSTATVQLSGSDGSPITLAFDTGAKFSKATWGNNASSPIVVQNKGWITISNAVINSTANGTSLGNKVATYGMWINDTTNVLITGCSVTNLYVRDSGSSDDDTVAFVGIMAEGSVVNYTVSNCIVTWCDAGIGNYPEYGTNIVISSNYVHYCSDSIQVGTGSATGYIVDTVVRNNDIGSNYPWPTGSWNMGTEAYHSDGIQTWAHYGGGVNTNLVIHGNYIHGNVGHLNSCIFISGTNDYATIYNNVMTLGAGSTNYLASGHIYLRDCRGTKIFNNTIVGQSTAVGNGIELAYNTTNVFVTNNIISTCNVYIYVGAEAGGIDSDFNSFYGGAGGGYPFYWHVGAKLTNEWQALGKDASSFFGDPSLVNTWELSSSSSLIGAGVVMNDRFTVDKVGSTRGAAWDIGAFEYGAESASSRISATLNRVELRGGVIIR